MRAVLVVAAAMAMGCRSTEAATTQQQPAGEWSCGAVHGAARLERRLGRDGHLALGAIADTNGTAPATMANLARLGGVFAREHVDAVLARKPDVALDEATVSPKIRAALERAKKSPGP